jgi:nitrite reductase/ring-hydroxylating ferredoxin subunit
VEGVPASLHCQRGELIVLRWQGRVRAYENRCPHRFTTLDWVPGRLMSADGAYLQCATHGALFRVEDGLCIHGPCQGDALVSVAVTVREGVVQLEEEP